MASQQECTASSSPKVSEADVSSCRSHKSSWWHTEVAVWRRLPGRASRIARRSSFMLVG